MSKTNTSQIDERPVTDEELRAALVAQVRVGASVPEPLESGTWSTVGLTRGTSRAFVKAFRARQHLPSTI